MEISQRTHFWYQMGYSFPFEINTYPPVGRALFSKMNIITQAQSMFFTERLLLGLPCLSCQNEQKSRKIEKIKIKNQEKLFSN